MKTQIALGIEARLSKHLLTLLPLPCPCDCDGANGGTVRRGSDQFHLNPMISVPQVVPQKRRGLVHVHDKNVYVAIVIEISKCRTRGSSGAPLCPHRSLH